jgi:hypothetical protein
MSKCRSVEFPFGLRVRCLCVRRILSPVMESNGGWTSTVDEGTWTQYA